MKGRELFLFERYFSNHNNIRRLDKIVKVVQARLQEEALVQPLYINLYDTYLGSMRTIK